MKIDPSLVSLKTDKASTPSSADRPANGAASPAPGAAQPDTIHLSALSSQLQALQSKLDPGAPFDRAKVEAIKSAIREGRLQVNPDVIADKMLADALALLGKGK